MTASGADQMTPLPGVGMRTYKTGRGTPALIRAFHEPHPAPITTLSKHRPRLCSGAEIRQIPTRSWPPVAFSDGHPKRVADMKNNVGATQPPVSVAGGKGCRPKNAAWATISFSPAGVQRQVEGINAADAGGHIPAWGGAERGVIRQRGGSRCYDCHAFRARPSST
jgi:hypothetical protein